MSQPVPQNKKASGVRNGLIIVAAGIVFAIAPITISLIAAQFGSNIGIVLHWFTLLTAPVGAIVAIVGLVIAARGSSRETVRLRGALRGTSIDTLPAPSPAITRTLRVVYLAGAALVAASALLRVTVFQPLGGILTLVDLTPVVLAVLLAKKALAVDTTATFLQFHRTQSIIGWVGALLAGPVGLFGLSSLEFLDEPEVVASQIIGTAITGLVPAVACVASLIVAGVLKAIYIRTVRDR